MSFDDFSNEIYQKNILIYGPGSNKDSKEITKLFRKYDVIFIFGPTVGVLLEQNIDISKYKIVLLCSGWFTDFNKEFLIKNRNKISYYLGSEIHTMHVLENYGIEKKRILHMANDYKKYGFTGFPTMGPKLMIFLIYYKFNFKKIKVMGLTFLMDFNDKNNIYDLKYKNFTNKKMFKDLSNTVESIGFSNDEISEFKGYKSYEDLPEKLQIKIINKRLNPNNDCHKNIYEGWNIFLRFLYVYKNKKIVLDDKLNELLKKYPNMLNEDPTY